VFGRSKSVVGLDIGSSAVKAVELKAVGKGYKVTALGNEPIPPGRSGSSGGSTAGARRGLRCVEFVGCTGTDDYVL
jgi:hypothetical protein